jgi:indolepyruvate decarboxylase
VTVSDTRALNEAVDETVRRIEAARQPVIILGVEVHRFSLQDDVVKLAEAADIPMAATMLGKGVVAETHPLYMGLYSGALGREEITKYVEGSDCVLMLGTFMTDINLGIYTAELDMSDCIVVTSEQLRIRHHHYHEVTLSDFVKTLAARKPKPKNPPPKAPTDFWKEPFTLRPAERITISRMIDRLDEQLDSETVVIADVGDALFASTELTTRATSTLRSARSSVDSPVSSSEKPRPELWSSNLKLGLPMMISGMSFCTTSMMSRARIFCFSFGVRMSTLLALWVS